MYKYSCSASSLLNTIITVAVLLFAITTTHQVAAQSESTSRTVEAIPFYSGASPQFYKTADMACITREGSYVSGNTQITYSNGRAGEHPQYGMGCYYRVESIRPGMEIPDVDENWFGQNLYNRFIACPKGFSRLPWEETCTQTRAAEEDSCPEGNPTWPGRGLKRQNENDYTYNVTATTSLTLSREYNSRQYITSSLPNILGESWFLQPFQRSLIFYLDATPATITAMRGFSKIRQFTADGSNWVVESSYQDQLATTTLESGDAGWRYTHPGNPWQEFYSADGRLRYLRHRNGSIVRLVYSDASTPANIAPEPGLLIQVTSDSNRTLSFHYNASGPHTKQST